MGFLIDILIKLLIAPFVFGWRRLRAMGETPVGLQASLADDMRAVRLVESPDYDAVYERVAQDIIGAMRYRRSVSPHKAAEVLFVSMDKAGARESSDEATETVISRIVWRVNSGNLR